VDGPGGVLRGISDGEVRRLFLGLKFAAWDFFGVSFFWWTFFDIKILSRTFLGLIKMISYHSRFYAEKNWTFLGLRFWAVGLFLESCH